MEVGVGWEGTKDPRRRPRALVSMGDFISPSPWAYPERGLSSQGVGEWEGTGQLNKILFIF